MIISYLQSINSVFANSAPPWRPFMGFNTKSNTVSVPTGPMREPRPRCIRYVESVRHYRSYHPSYTWQHRHFHHTSSYGWPTTYKAGTPIWTTKASPLSIASSNKVECCHLFSQRHPSTTWSGWLKSQRLDLSPGKSPCGRGKLKTSLITLLKFIRHSSNVKKTTIRRGTTCWKPLRAALGAKTRKPFPSLTKSSVGL